ncbi:Maltose permease MAL61 [Colletotrichum gloeosporioides]|uniref:Maltose permease MAL61 n=1 Tax=Colletotrichum gloeosporioides TaxID=474922 RepID=A0A8H4C8W8_COLGL|nr:Maltose permease MAL61 [Colletotrichum gloeosporioides]KAF3799336.1 Maltose permease MAL61 [Colletotrichum gloeosporioides]
MASPDVDKQAVSQPESSHLEMATKPGLEGHAGEAIVREELALSISENAKKHWRALLISSVGFTAGIAFAYDTTANGASISMPSFLLYFGDIGPTGPYLPSIWTSLWTAMSSLTQALGAILVGFIADRYGRKWPSCAAAILTLIGAAVQYIAVQRATLMGGKMITGLGIGAVMATATTYISEVAPLKLRAPLQTGLVVFVIFSQGLALAMVRLFVPDIREQAFRTVIAIQWGVGGLALLAWAAAPESPLWLVRKGKIEAARKVMRKIYGPNQPDERLEYEIRAIQAEQEFEANNKATYVACFQGTNRKRSLTVAFLYSTANIGGASFLAQNIYFLITAGLEAVHCFDVGIGGFGLAVLIILTSGVYLRYVNRRNVVLIGLVLNLLVMVIIGALYWADKKGGLWAIAVLMNILISLQSSLLQGAGWPIAAEIPSYSLRAKTLSIGICAQTFTTWVFNFITPYMYNVDSGNLGARTGWIYAGTSVFLFIGGWLWIPNTTGMTTEEIDHAYESGVAPRNFRKQALVAPDGGKRDSV